MQNLITRGISGTVYAIIFISAILYREASYVALISVFAAICLYEFNKLIAFKNNIPYAVLPLVIFTTKYFANEISILFLLFYTILCSVKLLVFLPKTKSVKTNSFIKKLNLTVSYIILPFTFLILLPNYKGNYTPLIMIFIIVLIWTNDSFAFILGKNFGKRKLLETVSPKKTIEGFLGGLLCSVLAGVLIGYFSPLLSIEHWIVIAILVSVLGSFGDLVESKFKRTAKVKDSGTIMPGHGGLLDRLDSLYFIAPFVYLYIHILIR
ncbi:phosphatidate cytidylyltransferase [Tenacibaculum sp. SG-28]|uniref:phosphatidate cytidylyltransferase n=1 Tax=Tenacibaculum sp. SG-28 TaxID=754426 RepID=UPI000CF49616|nr:phosphatidate cytidylyltransferase [Tenacibaculum sp. SG-28]PQJ23003.1 phosphatidate cytidylyltransferase [Tenacibaculum sp. SG-28]